MKKLLKKLSVMRLEERVLFDAAAAAAAVEAENQAQQNEELQQQQQQLQEQLAEEAARQQAAQEAPGTESELPQEDEAAGAQESAAQESGESAAAGSEVSAAVEAIAADEGIEVEESTDVLENDTDEVVGETVADVVATEVEADAEEGSADLEAAADAEESDEVLMTTEEVAAAIADGTRHELVIVSDSVKDSKIIIDGLAEGTEVLVLDRNSDVLDQINEYLDKSAVKYDSIHIVSHGGDGNIVLNSSMIDMESLQADPASWAAIGEHIAADGDILLYGCDVARSEDGKAFVHQLAALTGADVAASVDATGQYGWELEYMTATVAPISFTVTDYKYSLEEYTIINDATKFEDIATLLGKKEADVDGSSATATEKWDIITTVGEHTGRVGHFTRTVTEGTPGAWVLDSAWFETGPKAGNLTWALAEAYSNADLAPIFTATEANYDRAFQLDFSTNRNLFTLGDAVDVQFHFEAKDTVNITLPQFDIYVDGVRNTKHGLRGVEALRVEAGNISITNDQIDLFGSSRLELKAESTLSLGTDNGVGNYTLTFDKLDDFYTGATFITEADIVSDGVGNSNNTIRAYGAAEHSWQHTGDSLLYDTITVGDATNDVDATESTTLSLLKGHWTTTGNEVDSGAGVTVNKGDTFLVGADVDSMYLTVHNNGTIAFDEGGLDVYGDRDINVLNGDTNDDFVNFYGHVTITGEGSLITFSNTVTVQDADDTEARITVSDRAVFGMREIYRDGILNGHNPFGAFAYAAGTGTDSLTLNVNNGGRVEALVRHSATDKFFDGNAADDSNSSLQVNLDGGGELWLGVLGGEGLQLGNVTIGARGSLNLAHGDFDLKNLDLSEGGSLTVGNYFVQHPSLYETIVAVQNWVIAPAWVNDVSDDTTVDIKAGVTGWSLLDSGSANYNVSAGGVLNMEIRNSAIKGDIGAYDGTVNLTASNSQMYALAGVNSTVTIDASDVTFSGHVKFRGNSDVTIRGGGDAGVMFLDDFNTAAEWYVGNAFMFDDSGYYTTASGSWSSVKDNLHQDAESLRNGDYQVTVDLYGKAIFADDTVIINGGDFTAGTGNVIRSSHFTIHSGADVTFGNNGGKFAFGAGKFNIEAGAAVTFLSNVYISASYNGLNTDFNINGGIVNFNADVRNWVRSWRGNDDLTWTTGTSSWLVPSGDLVVEIHTDNQGEDHEYHVLKTYDPHLYSAVNFNGGTVSFREGTTYTNYGTFGVAKTIVSSQASVSFANIVNEAHNFAGEADGDWEGAGVYRLSQNWEDNLLTWSTEAGTNSVRADGISSDGLVPVHGSIFQIKGNTVVTGDVRNFGTHTNDSGYAGWTPLVGGAGFYVSVDEGAKGNQFLGTVTNEQYMNISGDGSVFTRITNSGTGTLELFGDNNFGIITNRGQLVMTGVAGAELSLVNYGDVALIGDALGLHFVNYMENGVEKAGLDMKDGHFTVASSIGEPGFDDISVSEKATLVFEVANIINGDVTNKGLILISSKISDFSNPFEINGNITNTGTFRVEGIVDFSTSSTINNRSEFITSISGIVYDGSFVNNGTLQIAQTAAFSALVNEVGGTVTFNPAAENNNGAKYTVFRNLVNRGNFNVLGEKILFADSLINEENAIFTVSREGTRFNNMIDAAGNITFVNRGTLRITGASAQGEFLDVDNYGTINAEATVHFGNVINRENGAISINVNNTLNFNGSVVNDGVIRGTGSVLFRYAAEGSGTFDLEGTGTVTYNYNQNVTGNNATVEIDSDGYYRIGGELVYYYDSYGQLKPIDSYANRPEFSTERNAWVIGDTVYSTLGAEFDAYKEGDYWYVGGQVLYNTADNSRPVYDAEDNRWEDNNGNAINAAAGEPQNAKLSLRYVANGFHWFINNTDSNLQENSVLGVTNAAAPAFDNTNVDGVWRVTLNGGDLLQLYRTNDGVNASEAEPLAVNIGQSVFGGSLINITVKGDATVADGETAVRGVTLGAGLDLEVKGTFDNAGTAGNDDGLRFVISEGASLNLVKNFVDDAGASFQLNALSADSEYTQGGTVRFDLHTAAGEISTATVNGNVINNGVIELAQDRTLVFNQNTTGNGTVLAGENSTVDYAAAADNTFFGGTYEKVILRGDRTLNSIATVNSMVFVNDTDDQNRTILTVTGDDSNLIVNGSVKGNTEGTDTSNFVFSAGSRGTFNSSVEYTVNDIEFQDGALGLTFSGSVGASITVEDLTIAANTIVRDSDYSGIIAQTNTRFNTVSNSARFTVNDSNVVLGDFTLNAGALLELNADMTFDGTNSELLTTNIADNNVGIVNVNSGTLTFSQTGADVVKALFNLAPDAAMEINNQTPDAQIKIWGVNVAENASLTVRGLTAATDANVPTNYDVAIGVSANNATYGENSGLTLNGNLLIDSGLLRVWNYNTTMNDGRNSFSIVEGVVQNWLPADGSDDYSARSAKITVETSAGLYFAGQAELYGYIYTANTQIENISGVVQSGGPTSRIGGNAVTLDNWILIDTTQDYSTGGYADGGKFLVIGNDTVFTIDGTDVVIEAIRVNNNASLVVAGTNVTFNSEVRVDADTDAGEEALTVNGSAVFNGDVTLNDALNVTGSGSVTFNADSVLTAGEGVLANAADESTVIYNFEGAALAGTYNNLTINGAAVSVGNVTITGLISGSGVLNFNGTTAGIGSVSGTGFSAVYNANAATVYGTGEAASYRNITLIGNHTVSSNLKAGNLIAERNSDNTAAVITVADNIQMTLGSVTNVENATIFGNSRSKVTYDVNSAQTVTVFNGRYYDLEFKGANTNYEINDLLLTDELSGNAKTLKINGVNANSNGRLVAADVDGNAETLERLNVQYTSDAILTGEYGTLTINREGVVNVLGDASAEVQVRGTMRSAANLLGEAQFHINTIALGNGTFGTNAQSYAGTVFYHGAAANGPAYTVFSGNYSGITFADGVREITNAFNADTMTVNAGSNVSVNVTDGTPVEVHRLNDLNDRNTGTGAITVQDGSVFSIGAGSTIGYLINQGEVIIADSGVMGDNANLANLLNRGTLTVADGALATVYDSTIAENVRGDVIGLYRVSDGGTLQFNNVVFNREIANVHVSESGLVRLVSGTNVSFKNLTGTGTVAVEDGATLNFSGTGIVADAGYDYVLYPEDIHNQQRPEHKFDGLITVNGSGVFNVKGHFEVESLLLTGNATVNAGLMPDGADPGFNEAYLVINWLNRGENEWQYSGETSYTINASNNSTVYFRPQNVVQNVWGSVVEDRSSHIEYDAAWWYFNELDTFWITIRENTVLSELIAGKGYHILEGAELTVTLSSGTVSQQFWIEGFLTVAGNAADSEFVFSNQINNLGEFRLGENTQRVTLSNVYGDYTGTPGFGEHDPATVVAGIVTAGQGTIVEYTGNDKIVFAGTYDTLRISAANVQGAQGETVINSLLVSRGADITFTSDELTINNRIQGAGSITFNNTASGNAQVTDVSTLTITYNNAGYVFGGVYNGQLIFTGENTVSNVISASGAVTLSGVLNVTETASVTFSGTTDANSSGNDGYINAANGSKFTYGADAAVYSGTYGDLTINGDHNLLSNYIEGLGTNQGITINGAATLDGIMTGNAKVTFNGETSGNATFGDIATDKTYTGVVTYGADSGAVFGGQYNNIVIEGDHSVAADINVNVIDGGMFRLNSTLTLNDRVSMTLNGLTDANAEGNTGRIIGADTSTVTYGYNASIYGGTYGNLIANGTEYTLNNDVIINGEANLKGTFLGDVDVTFNGKTFGNALFGVIDDATRVFGGTVSYAATALTVYGGNYYSLEIAGDRTLGASFAVNNSADIAGVMSGSANVTFAQGALLQGGAFFGAEGADYTGTVTYNGVDNVYGGFYSGLNFSNGNTVSTAVSASGAVQLAGALNVSSTGSVAFNGTTDANVMTPDRNTGVIFGDSGSKVSYGAAADVYNGVYGDLAINGDHTLLVNGEHEAGIIINGKAELSGIMSGNTKVTFNGDSDGDATFGNIASDTTYTGTVTYGVGATTIYGGQYNNIVIAGDSSVSHTVNSSLLVNVPSGGRFELASELILEENVILTLNGLTDANAEGNTGSITGHATSEVLYSGDADVYGGSYGKLTFTGSEYTLLNNFSVAADALINGNIIGSADIVFNGAVSGNAVFGNLETNVIYGGSVTYAPSADHSQTVFGGNYSTLNITGSHELNQKFAVNTAAAFNDGIMSGSADITFAQGAILTGNGTIGAAADNRYQGNVVYNGVSGETGVFGGFYSNLVLANGNSTSAAVDAADVKLSGVLTVTGTGSVNFAGTTDAAVADNDGSITADATASVSYAGTADVYGGTYGNLTITGDHTLYFDLTVNGLATITGTQTLEGSGTITFNGTTNADDAGSGTFADDMVLSTVVYSGTAAVFGGSYGNLNISGPHTLNNTLSVAGSAEFSGKQTLGSGVSMTLSGATNADAKDSEGNNIASIDGSAGSVTYDGVSNQGIYIGTYGNLTITGDHLLSNSFSVEGNFASGAVLSGTADVTFNGTTAADGTVFGTASEVYAGRVTYSETAATVYGGYYTNLVISGNHTLGNDFAVNTAAEITGVMSGTAKVTFAQDSVLTGGATFGAAADARYEGEVVYNGVETVYGGFYSALTLDGGNTVSVDVDVLNAKLSDVLTVTGTGSVNFAGTTDAAAADNDGSITADAASSVSYAGTADVYGGTYGNLTITGDHTLYFDVTVNGLATITGTQTLEGSGTITFNGTTNADDAGSGTFADDMVLSTVVYSGTAAVFGGSYGNLNISGPHTLNNTLSVAGSAEFSGKQTLGSGVSMTLSGATNADAKDSEGNNIASIDGSAGSVTYDGVSNQGIYIGTYGNLTITGDHLLSNSFSVEGNFASGAVLSGTADVTFNGTTAADGTVFGTASEVYAGRVTYSETAATVYGGYYTNLVISGNHTLGNDFAVNTAAEITGVMSGTAKVTFAQDSVLTGGATFGAAADARYEGEVVYNGVETVYGGFYSALTLDGGNTVSVDVDVLNAKLSDVLTVTETGSVNFAGTTDAAADDNDGSIAADAASSVSYAGTADVYGGTYGNLTITGDHTLYFDLTVNGLATITGTQTLEGPGTITFNGTTNADEAGSGTFADDAFVSTVTYGAQAAVFGGSYGNLTINGDHTLTQDFSVSANAVIEGVISGTAAVQLLGVNSGSGSFGRSADERYNGIVTYDANEILSGFYGGAEGSAGLIINNGAKVLQNVVVDAYSVELNGALAVAEGGTMRFSGYTDALVKGNAAQIDSDGVVDYAVTADIYGGKYTDLVIRGDRYFRSSLTVLGTTTIYDNADDTDASLTSADGVQLIFSGAVNGNGAYFGDGTNAVAASVTYNSAEGEILGGIYNDLTVTTARALSNNFEVTGSAVFGGNQTLGSGVEIRFTGSTNGNESVEFEGAADSSVYYKEGVTVYNGSYGTLILDGAFTLTDKTITASTEAEFNGRLTLAGNTSLTLSGVNSGTIDQISAGADTTVVYNGAADQTVFAGTYGNLEITGAHTLTNSFSVAGKTDITGTQTLSGAVEIAFNGVTNGSESDGGTLVDDTEDGILSSVSYSGEADVFSGSYGNLTITGDHVLIKDFSVEGAFASGALLSGDANVTLNGTTADDGTRFGDERSSYAGHVIYGTTAESVYQGSYADLTITGDHVLANDFSVAGAAVITGTQTLKGAVAIEFNGTTNAAEGAIFNDDSSDSEFSAVTYAGEADVYTGTYGDLTINGNNGQSTAVIGDLTVQGMLSLADNDMFLVGDGDWTIGKTNASEDHSAIIYNDGTVTYNGLAAGESGWIFNGGGYENGSYYEGGYENLVVIGGNYSVNSITIQGTVTGDATGKIIFQNRVGGEGVAQNVNADYMSDALIFKGTYNDLGINRSANFAEEVTVNGRFSALSSNAIVEGGSTLTLAGTMEGFNGLGRFNHTGEVKITGTADPFEFTGGHVFETLNVGAGTTTYLAQTTVRNSTHLTGAAIYGSGDIYIGAEVYINAPISMTGGTVTYQADATDALFGGVYYNLNLEQSATLVMTQNVTVTNLLDVNSHDILNNNELTVYTFTDTADSTLINLGTLTFGSYDDTVTAPAVRQVWEGLIANGITLNGVDYTGTLIINRSNYTINNIYNYEGSQITVDYGAAPAGTEDVVQVGVFSEINSIINLRADVALHDGDDHTRFTNYGTLNISGRWGALSSMHVFNLTQSTINVTDGQFTFGDNIKLTNSGLVVAGSNGELTFAEVNENLSGRPVYQTADGGVFKFDFASDSINISNGLLGELKNYDGTMYFLTDGMKYLGKLTNGRGTDTYGYAYFWADTTLKESVVSTFGLLQIGNGSDDISVNFLHNVVTNSRFEILNNAHAVFESIVSVVHEFYMESGSSALFMDEVRVYSTSNNQVDSIFHVKAGADATFLSDVFNQNGYGFHERDKWTVTLNNAVQSITGTFAKVTDVYTDTIINSKDWASDSDKLSKLVIDGHVVINGKLSNIAYGWNSDDNQANVVVNSDGNVFGAIDNRGSAARFDMNGSNNQFNGAIFNTGNLFLNGTNDYNDLQTAHCSISFIISSPPPYVDQTINNGYVWVNDGATGSTFREIKIGKNSGVEATNPTFTVVSYNNEGIDLTFTGEVFNWGRFNINSDGSVFNRDVVNYNQFRINGVAQFNALFTNNSIVRADVTEDGEKRLTGAELSIGAAGTRFNQISNAGIIGIDAYTILEGSITNTGIINFNVSGMNFSNIVNNGVINLHNAKQIVVQNLTIGESSVIDIDKLSSLHLHVVSEEYTGDYDNENYNYADDAKLGTIFVRGDARNGLYEAHTTPDVSDSEHGLFFEDTGRLQTISSRIVYDTLSVESAIWFNSHTVLNYEDATWIIVHSGQRITLDEIGSTEKYKVMTGGSLTVKDTASGTRIQVNGGTVIFDNDDRALTITGLLEVRSGTAVFDSARALNFTRNVFNAGTVTFNGGSVNNFNGGFTNAATGVVNAQTNVNGHIANSGMYNTVADGIVIGSSFTNTATGTLSVTANTQLEALIGGTINVQQKGTLTVEVTEINSNLLNNGTVVVSNSANYLGVTGSILKGNGTFTSADPATLVFAGDVATGTAAVFQNIYNVEYTGTSENGQNIILGTYNNLTLNGAFKVVDDGAVIVNGGFANNNEVKITDDGELILNGNVAGNGIYSNEGLLVFSETASGSAATVNNSGVANVNADNFNVASGSNTGSLNINGDGVSASVENTGSLIINGNDVDLNTVNNGSVTVNGSNADLAGQNNSSVTVNGSAATTMSDQAGASYNVAQGGALSLGDNGGTYNAVINNKGTVTVDAPVNSFAGGVNNEGVVAVNSGNGLDFAALMNGNANGTVALNDEIDLRNRSINGTVEVNYSLTDEDVENMIITENSVFGINSDSTFKAPISTNNGTVRVGRDAELTLEMQDAEIKGNYDIDGVISVRGDSKFTDSVDNSGTIKTEIDGEITFAGSTSGAGRVEGNAVYEGSKIGVFGGDYSKLTIINDATLNADAVVETLALEGSLATAEGASMTINGETLGAGTMAGGKGEIVYNGNSAEQTIYAGLYNDITIGQDATGNFDIAGDIAVQGDAFNRSTNGAELAVSSGTVTYNGTGTQNVMAGTYDELIMAGSGSTKLMETDVFNVNSFISDGGSHSGMITLTSAEAPGKWTLNAVSSSIDYSFVDYADTTKPIFLNGTNMTGSGNSHNWALFNGAGGVGDSFPSINNPNFQAIAPYMSDLHYGWAATDRFDIFRRMPVDRAPIVVGDMSDLVVLNNFEAYDMIDFDGEFFGQEGISILDEEAREVLDDAASAEAADLKALLED